MNLRDKFTVEIVNRQTTAKRIALATGNVDTMRISAVTANNVTTYDHDFVGVANLRVIDSDLTHALDDYDESGVIKMQSRNNGSIRSALNYLRHNPRKIVRMIISADDVATFKGNLTVGSNIPFGKPTLKELAIDDYFSTNQFQNDKVVMDFSDSPIEWNDMLYMAMDIPAAESGKETTVTVSFEFAE